MFATPFCEGFLVSQHCLQTYHGAESHFAMHLNAIQEALNGNMDTGFPILHEFVDAFIRDETVQRDAGLQHVPLFQGQVAMNAIGGIHAQQQQARATLEYSRRRAMNRFGHRTTHKIEDSLSKYLEAMKDLKVASDQAAQKGQSTVSGIGHEYDRLMETNKMVFGILGIHTLNYGEIKEEGDEHDQGVHLIFKPESLYHPDAYVTPMAATFYNSGHGDKERPWWKERRPKTPFDAMAWEKLHPSSPLFFEALATEFLARGAHKNGEDLSRTKFQDMKKYMKAANAHLSVECHLPYVTPLAWVEKVVISEHTFNKLSTADQAFANDLFRGRLEIAVGTASEEKQWQLATAPLPRPLPPPAFAWTVLSTRHQDVIVPGMLQQKGRTRIFFRTSRPHFTANLFQSHQKDGLKIEVSGAWCRIVTVRKEQLQDWSFNHGVGAESGAVMYCIDLDYQKKQVIFTHAGVSHMLNRRMLEVPRVNPMPKFLSFTLPPGHMAFTDVRILFGQEDEHLLEHERMWVEEKVMTAAGPERKVKMAFEAERPGFITRAYQFVTGKTHCGIPPCPDGVHCQVAYQKKDRSEQEEQHMAQKRHICLYGHSCKDHNESSEHDERFTHIEKELCQHGDQCRQLCDPYHRAEYHHPGFWDLLLRCREGAACRKREDKLHCQKYHHEKLAYVVNENGLQLQELFVKNMKKEHYPT